MAWVEVGAGGTPVLFFEYFSGVVSCNMSQIMFFLETPSKVIAKY
jgi:hypothetical protein